MIHTHHDVYCGLAGSLNNLIGLALKPRTFFPGLMFSIGLRFENGTDIGEQTAEASVPSTIAPLRIFTTRSLSANPPRGPPFASCNVCVARIQLVT